MPYSGAMNTRRALIKLYRKTRGILPSPLPQGVTEFNAWADYIFDTYTPPMTIRDVKFTLSALLMRLGQADSHISNRYFAKCLHSGAAKQVGAYVMEEIKHEQKQEYAAQQESAKQQVATAVEATCVPIQN